MCRLRWSSGSASPGHDDDDDDDGDDDDDDDDILMETAMMMMTTMMVMKERMKIPFQGQRQWQLGHQWRLPGKNHNKTIIFINDDQDNQEGDGQNHNKA